MTPVPVSISKASQCRASSQCSLPLLVLLQTHWLALHERTHFTSASRLFSPWSLGPSPCQHSRKRDMTCMIKKSRRLGKSHWRRLSKEPVIYYALTDDKGGRDWTEEEPPCCGHSGGIFRASPTAFMDSPAPDATAIRPPSDCLFTQRLETKNANDDWEPVRVPRPAGTAEWGVPPSAAR